jgi:hypothetical protein
MSLPVEKLHICIKNAAIPLTCETNTYLRFVIKANAVANTHDRAFETKIFQLKFSVNRAYVNIEIKNVPIPKTE